MAETDPRTLIERLEKETSRGRLWRAKELAYAYTAAQPHIDYDPALWLACGKVLFETHDLEQAGRLLFFAGSEAPEHKPAIDLYLKRHDSARLGIQLSKLPPVDALPDVTRRALEKRGARPRERRESKTGVMSDIVPCAFLLALGALVIVGGVTVYRAVVDWLNG